MILLVSFRKDRQNFSQTKKSGKTQLIKIRIESGDIIADLIEIKRIIRESINSCMSTN